MAKTKLTALILSAAIVFLPVLTGWAPQAHAAVSDWAKGAALVPTWNGDFGSDSAKQSIKNLHDTGANYVVLVIPIYQSNIYSTDVAAGYNTPTDDSLGAAIDYAHSLGMSVALKIHDDPYDGQWRANINPSDRNAWFSAYNTQLVHFAQVAASHHVEMIVIGTELVSMAASNMNGSNTSNWVSMIQNVRAVYTGKLTYGANSNDNSNDPFQDEKKFIGFWQYLDYAGLSAYYTLNSDNSVDGLKGAWNYWNQNDIKGFAQSVGKPVIFTEIGYRSISGAHQAPWDYTRGGGYDATEQANDYDALMGYFNDYPYIAGVFWWAWSTNPGAGGSGDTGYTPQNKPAQSIMSKWFTTPTAPQTPPVSQASFNSTANPNPSGVSAGSAVTLNASIQNLDGPVSHILVDIEVYNQNGTQIFQIYHSDQQFGANETRNFAEQWTPNSSGAYTIKIGVFSNDWTQVYNWNDQAGTVTVSGGSTSGGGTSNSGGTGSSSGTAAVTEVWWPTNDSTLSGTQPLKIMVDGYDPSTYTSYWQVDSGGRVQMSDSTQDYPHKEALVDFTGWTWKGQGPYTLTFTSVDKNGAPLSQKSVNITTQQ